MADYGLKTINSDDIYEYPAKKATPELDRDSNSVQTEDKTFQSNNAMSKQASYLDGRLGVVIDGNRKDP